ncbi:polysaccharide biosynthesis protein [uncultured Algibacter sp.]|uniref:polysaccharide biosynthesis protein n=1 Tax=uncultured Algibacter sp. TaxID=298659 RepID=UPI00260F7007|nr:polysaccharide biosynthesis protein [uncultured Algibacter sp.]
MTKETANHIDELLYGSGLFSSTTINLKSKVFFDFSDEIILITGAAGSIGSGLTKQLINCKYQKLILIDKAESDLYELIKDLEFEKTINIEFILLDIIDEKSIKKLFEVYKPSIVFHTAAYKHVPLMESHPYEAVKLNIFGTKLLADLSVYQKVKKFIFISTDKAVNPINIMGISKKIGENYLNFLNAQSNTLFITTRFGNIFGSNGSIVPLIKKQIEFGNPITVTDINISRYFISKYRACELILKLASLQNYNSRLYTFNMGNPIKITNIIERLISFYGNPEKKSEIKIIGLRPGEKLKEDIIAEDELFGKTEDSDILSVTNIKKPIPQNIDFKELQNITPFMTKKEIKNILLKYI